MGRSSIDLYSNDIGAAFPDIKTFGAFVGGCPTNVSVGTRRLGLKSALLTAMGDDPVADFMLKFLDKEGVETRFIPRKAEFRTSAVVLGIEPPDKFPLVYYRSGCADIEITIDDVLAAPLDETRALFITGTGLSKEPSRSATIFAAERARGYGATVLLDIDFRADQWHDPRAFGVVVRSVLDLVDVAIGSEAEVKATALTEASQLKIEHSQVSDPNVTGDVSAAIESLLDRGVGSVVLKQGTAGSSVYLPGGDVVHADPFGVEVCNILGAGDGYASGLIYGLLKGWDWRRSLRMANAVGAILVTRQACANAMPFEQEAADWIEARGGF
ncbi:MAG: 5-dehydro-2-deoxygluconokinase [Phycisphaerae bacterium]|nr:5-dehydro-2-deoxygluconokinase [Phycisphaerae bacterium]